MKTILLTAFGLAMTLMGFSQFNVTFRVDMSQSGLTFTEANVTGTFSSWCGGCIAMTDSDMDGIWEVTVPLDAGTYEYKFTADGWTASEQLAEGGSCTITTGGFTNRLVTIDADVVLPVVCYGICSSCPEVALQQMDLPVTFDNAAVEYGLIGFGGAEASTVVVDPENPANMVGKVIKSATAELWAGTTITAPSQLGLANPIPFAAGQTRMTLRVWSPDAGIPVRLKVEDHTDPTHSVETESTTTVGGAWEVLVFDFANEAPGTAALNFGYAYDKASVFFNFGTTGAIAGEKTYYMDELAFDEVIVEPQTYQITFSVDMNSFAGSFGFVNLSGSFNDWCGNCSPMSDDDMDGVWTAIVPLAAGNYEYKFSYDNWAGSEQLTGGFCTVNTGGFVNRSLEVSTDAVLPLVCFERCVACDAIELAQMDLPVTFDLLGTEYGLIGFGGAENSTVVEDPTQMGNMVAKVVKSATAELWAGTTITAPSQLGLLNPVPFTATQTQMTLRVWSPDAGIPVRLKLEEHADNTHTVETEATTTLAGEWETLTFDFSNQASGTAALNLAYAYDKASVFFNFGTTGAIAGEKIYYFDDLDFDGTVVEPVSRTITFQVDMNNSGVTFTQMNLSGSFNDWCGDCAPMSDENADGVWEYTTTLLDGTYEYKFSYDNWAGSEQLADGSCTINTGGFVNRSLVVSADAVLPVVCFARCVACDVVELVQMDLPVTFDLLGTEYGLIGFGGADNSTIVEDPTQMGNMVAKVVKSATAELWAGTTITAPAQLGLLNPVPFTATQTRMTLRVWSPDAGIPVRLKVEDHANSSRTVETESTTTLAGQWETLTFDFSNEASGTAALNLTYAYDKASVFFNFGTTGAIAGEKIYYFDDLAFDETVVEPVSRTVTFQVDMNNSGATFTQMNVSGTFNNWCGDCAPMTDANADGIWEYTTTMLEGTHEFKFSHDNWAGSEQLVDGFGCTVNNNGFINRSLVVSADVVLPVVCYASCSACNAANTYNVLFRVDMNNVTSAFTTPEVNGTFNGWCGGCAPMSDADGDGIWELNIALEAGSYEYKFAYDNWAGQETLTPGSACTITTGAFTNRLIAVSGDVALDVVCWESCSACDNPSGPFNITFQVDMGDVSANFTTPEVNGTFNGWCGNCAAMTDANGDDIWEITIPLQAGSYDYKFSYDAWAGQESLTPGSSCTTTTDGFTNRSLVVTENATLPIVCWESCEACVASVNENEMDAVQVYPNPVSDELQINLSLNASNTAVMNVIDASGRIVMQKQLNNMSRIVVDTKTLNDGFYFIQVVNEGTVMTKSFVVQH